MAGWVFLGGLLVTTALGQVAFKGAFLRRRRWLLVAAVLCFLAATSCAYLALRRLPIGTVYMSTAVTQLLVAGLARVVLRETWTRDHAIGLALIVAGVVLYAR